MYKSVNFSYVWLSVTLFPVIICAKTYRPISMDLLDKQPGNTFSNYTVLEHEKYTIDILNINDNVSFFVIQLHSYIENITLSYDDTLQTNSYTTGTNIGLVWSKTMGGTLLEKDTARFFLIRNKPIDEEIKILFAVSTYAKDDPIPGGCNLSFETMIAPYQKIFYDDSIITVVSQPPSKNEVFCNRDNIDTDMYYMYLKEYDNDTDDYFLGIQDMLTVESILKYGSKVPSGLGPNKFKQMYNSYRGTGRVFAVISTLNGKSSAYVPAVSYGCNLNHWSEECIGPFGVHWKLICAFLLILGIFICFGGHRFFKTGLFIVGFTFGAIVTLLLVCIDDYFSTEVKVVYSLATGIVCGSMWLLLWWKFGAPLVSLQLTFLLSGTLIASIILYNELGDLLFLADDIFFWLVFSTIVIITLMPIFFYPSLYHIVALSLVGSYAFVVAVNYYVGGNLPYIIINTYRRIAVPNFGSAVVDPPYQLLDFTHTILWALLFGVGAFVQYRHSRGKAPFPPHRNGVDARYSANERTPLIQPEVAVITHTIATAPANEMTALLYPERVAPPPYHA